MGDRPPRRLARQTLAEIVEPRYEELFALVRDELRRAGLAGATAFKGIEGYGGHAAIHAARVFDIVNDLPILIEVVDTEERIRAFLPVLDGLLEEGLVTLENVEFIRYGREKPR